jgi:hypothetical protein
LGIRPKSVKASPAGQLAHFISNWQILMRDKWTIKGYEIELVAQPFQTKRPYPPTFNQTQQKLITKELTELCSKGAVTEITQPIPVDIFFSILFLVPKKDSGQRPVINLKNLNSFVNAPHFKMEGIHTLKNLIRKEDWLVKIDLKDAYFSVPICQEH